MCVSCDQHGNCSCRRTRLCQGTCDEKIPLLELREVDVAFQSDQGGVWSHNEETLRFALVGQSTDTSSPVYVLLKYAKNIPFVI